MNLSDEEALTSDVVCHGNFLGVKTTEPEYFMHPPTAENLFGIENLVSRSRSEFNGHTVTGGELFWSTGV
jgi:hypothetical protein